MPLNSPFRFDLSIDIHDQVVVNDLVEKLFEGESSDEFFAAGKKEELRKKMQEELGAIGSSGKDAAEFNKQLEAFRRFLIERRIEHFLKEEVKADTLYTPEQYDTVKNMVVKTYYDKRDDGVKREQLLEDSRKHFTKRKEALKHYINVMRQKKEIEEYELNPGKIDVLKAQAQMLDRLPLESNVAYRDDRWFPLYQGNGEPNESHLASIIGGTEASRKAIIERDTPIIWTTPPSKLRRNAVFDAVVDVKDELTRADLALKVFFEEGQRSLTEEEIKKHTSRSRIAHAVSNLMEGAAVGAVTTFKKLSRGIASHSQASEDDRYKKFLAARNEMLARMLWKIGPNPESHAAYLKALKLINDELAGSSDYMDQATFAKMQNLIADAIKQEGAANEAEVKAFQDKLNDINNEMLEELQKHVNKEDEMWKYRVLQVFLLATPFGAFSAFNFFDYTGPIANLLAPLFSSSHTLGHGLGEIATSKLLDPFGLGKMIGVDKAIEWGMENIPVIKQLGQLFDFVTDNEIFQTVGGAAASVLVESPLTQVAIAAAYSGSRLKPELEHHIEQKKTTEEKKKELEAVGEEFSTKQKENIEARARSFSDKRFNIQEQAHKEAKLAEFIAQADDAVITKLFGAIHFHDSFSFDDLRGRPEPDRSIEFSAKNLIERFSKNPQEASQCFTNFAIFEALKEELRKEVEEEVAKSNAGLAPDALKEETKKKLQEKTLETFGDGTLSAEKEKELYAAHKGKIEREFIIKASQEAGLTSNEKDEKKKIEDLRTQLKKKYADDLANSAKEGVGMPDPKNVHNPKCWPLFDPRTLPRGIISQ